MNGVLRYRKLFNIMTRGAGSLRCSGILSDAGPLVDDRGVQDAANRFRAAAAPAPYGLFPSCSPWISLLFLPPSQTLEWVRWEKNGSNRQGTSR